MGVLTLLAAVALAVTVAGRPGGGESPDPQPSDEGKYTVMVFFETAVEPVKIYTLQKFTIETTGSARPPQPPPNKVLKWSGDDADAYGAADDDAAGYGYHGEGHYRKGEIGEITVVAAMRPARVNDPKHRYDELQCTIMTDDKMEIQHAVRVDGDLGVRCHLRVW